MKPFAASRAADQIDEVRTAMSENTETAILAGGCFWPAQELLRHRDGIISTRVGYTGGENDNPTTDHHPGHAEAVEVTFDPARTSYRAILEFFFQIHRPDLGEELVGSDYRSEIFYTSDEARPFWEAEAEDQNYLQHYPDGKNQFSP
jgi:peptide-methionine (S)-S-oxide reductase